MVPALLAGTVIALGLALALVVKIPSTAENFPVLIVLGTVVIDCKLLLLCALYGFAEVFEKSKHISYAIRLNILGVRSRKERRWAQQFLRSCGAIKMKFGGNNFVDRLTPLNCISHAVQISTQILLLGRNH